MFSPRENELGWSVAWPKNQAQGLPYGSRAWRCNAALSSEKQQKMTWDNDGAPLNTATVVATAIRAARSAGK
jgi:hypothetical protein